MPGTGILTAKDMTNTNCHYGIVNSCVLYVVDSSYVVSRIIDIIARKTQPEYQEPCRSLSER